MGPHLCTKPGGGKTDAGDKIPAAGISALEDFDQRLAELRR